LIKYTEIKIHTTSLYNIHIICTIIQPENIVKSGTLFMFYRMSKIVTNLHPSTAIILKIIVWFVLHYVI